MLKVEAAGHPIHIQKFSHQIQASLLATGHRGQVQFLEGHPAGGDKLLAKGTAAANPIAAGPEGLDEALLLGPTQISPALQGIDGLLHQ